MRRRESMNSTESLELLLDTICNTFGAVIFLAMLVALLVGQAAPEVPVAEPPTAAETASILAEIQEAQERLRILSGQYRQQEQIRQRLASSESEALAGKLRQQTEQQLRFMSEKSTAVQEAADTQAQTVTVQQTLERQQRRLQMAKAQQQQLQTEMQQLQELSSRTAAIPRLRKTTKDAVVFVIDDGHLYQITTSSLAINSRDTQRSTRGGIEVIQPRSGSGTHIGDTSAAQSSVRKKFSDVHAGQHFVTLYVSRDSFAEFAPVKAQLVKLGIEYEVIIGESNDVELSIGNSMRESLVQ